MKPVSPSESILYGIDSRAQEEIEWLTNYYGTEEVNRLFGRPICTGDVAAKNFMDQTSRA